MPGLIDRIQVIVSASTGAAVTEFGKLERATKDTQSATDRLGRAFGVTGQTIKAGLVAGAAALIGTGLVTYLNDSVEAYGDAAKAAGELSTATGSSVETVSRLTAALEDAGISAEQTAGLLTKFTANIGKNKAALDELGVSLVKNKDGSVDYAATMVKVVDAIGQIEDGAKRTQLYIQFFGKAGAAAFRELEASGVKLADAMAAISKYRVFTTEDVKRAVAYDDAMDQLKASTQSLQFALGRALVPALSAVASGFAAVLEFVMPVVEVFTMIPGHVYATATAVALLGIAIQKNLVAQGFDLLFTGLVNVSLQLIGFGILAKGMVAEMGFMAAASQIATAGLRGMQAALLSVAAAAAPLLLVALAIEAIMGQMHRAQEMQDFTHSADNLNKSLQEQAETLESTDSAWSTFLQWVNIGALASDTAKVQYNLERLTNEYESQAKAVLENADATDAQREAAQRLLDIMGDGTDEQQANNLATEEGTEARNDFITATSGMAGIQDRLNTATASLNDMLAEGGHTYEELAQAARDAQQATADKTAVEIEAQRIMDENIITIGQYADALDRLAQKIKGPDEALNNLQETLSTTFVDIDETWGNELTIGIANIQSGLADLMTSWDEAGLSVEQQIAELNNLKLMPGISDQAIAEIDKVIAGLQGLPDEEIVYLTMETDLSSISTADLQNSLDNITNNVALKTKIQAEIDRRAGEEQLIPDQTVNVTVNADTSAAESDIQGIAKDTTVAVKVESRGGPAVKEYLAGITSDKTALIRLESRNGPAVKAYIDGLTADRLALIRIESRNGPAVDAYIDGIANQDRTAIIDIRTRGATAARRVIDGLTGRQATYVAAPPGVSTHAASTPIVNNNYSIRVEGALDPVGTASTIERVLKKQDARMRGQPSWL